MRKVVTLKRVQVRHRLAGIRPNSFTLVELLVVVSIVGLLAALAIPVTQKAIDAGKTGKATGNLRQIGILINSYVSENNNCLPILIDQNNMGQSPYSATSPFRFWQNFVRSQAGLSVRQVANFNTDPWLPEIFYDPARKKKSHPWGDFGGNDSIMLGLGQPAPKNCDSVFPGNTRGTPLAALGKLSQKVIVASAMDQPGSSWGSSWYFQGNEYASQGEASSLPKPEARHGGRALCLFADGHIEALDTKKMSSADRKKYFVLPQNE